MKRLKSRYAYNVDYLNLFFTKRERRHHEFLHPLGRTIITALPECLQEFVLDMCLNHQVFLMIFQAEILHGGGNDVVMSDLKVLLLAHRGREGRSVFATRFLP